MDISKAQIFLLQFQVCFKGQKNLADTWKELKSLKRLLNKFLKNYERKNRII